MKAIKYDLNNKKLNNDLREYLSSKNAKYDYIKDYQNRLRYVLYLEKYFNFNIEEFKQFVIKKRKSAAGDVLDGLFNW